MDTIAEFIDPALALAWQTLRLQFQLGDALQINFLLCTTISQHWHEGGHWHWRWHEGGHWHWRIHFKGKRPQEPLDYVGRTNTWEDLGEPVAEQTPSQLWGCYSKSIHYGCDAIFERTSAKLITKYHCMKRRDQQLEDEEALIVQYQHGQKQCCSRSTRGKLRRPKREGLVYKSVGT